METKTATTIPSITTSRNSRIVTVLGLIVMILVWGSFPVASKLGIQGVPPLFFSSTRFLLAAGLMTILLLAQGKKIAITGKQHVHVLLMSLLMVGIPASIFFSSIPYAPAGVLTLMWSPTPIFTALFNLGSKNEIRGWRLPISLLIGSCGLLLVIMGHIPFGPGSTDSSFTFASSGIALTSELAVLGSCVIYGFGMRLAKHSSPEVPITVLTTWQLLYTGLFVGLMGVVFERNAVIHPTWATFGYMLYLAVFCSCIGFFLTFWLIRRIGAIRTAYTDFVIPGVTLLLSYLLLGENLTWAKVAGFMLVMLGCVLVQM